MQNTVQDSQELFRCAGHGQRKGMVLISIGNQLRQDDGIGPVLLDNLPQTDTVSFCRFNLGSYSSYLLDCLKGHDRAIVIDSMVKSGQPGKITLLDLNELIAKNQTLKLNSCHGFSLLDELKLARWQGDLPQTLYFFGIEADSCNWTEGLTPTLKEKIPTISTQLQNLMASMNKVTSHA